MKLKKLFAFCLALAVIGSACGCGLLAENLPDSSSSQVSEEVICEIEKADGKVVITVTECEGEVVLADVMQLLQEEGKLSYIIADGMVTEMEGMANTGNSYWMLYTDHEFSNTEWGTVEYNGKTYASAMFGAENMPAEQGAVYVWSYETFSW